MKLPSRWHAPLTGWSALEAIGVDAARFLNNFCTNEVVRLAVGEACEAFFTDVKAHVLAYTTVARGADDRFVVLLSSDKAEVLHDHLDRYLIREKVELRVLPHGPTLVTVGTTPGTGCDVVPLPAYGAEACAWFVEHEHLAPIAASGSMAISTEQFERYRLRHGIPHDCVDVDLRNLPQEVDRNRETISFTKGCYLGQEPVARIDALGQVNWLLRRLTTSGPELPRSDTELKHETKQGGRITSAVADGEEILALGYVRREHAQGATLLDPNGRPFQVVPGEASA